SNAKNLIEKSRTVIVNSNNKKNEILKTLPLIPSEKLKVIYPYYYSRNVYDKNIKKRFRKEFNIDKKSRIIFFRASDLEKRGLSVVFYSLSRLYQDNFTLIIESTIQQITPVKLKMEKSELKFNYILFNDYKNIDELFMVSDIFILPTTQEFFALDILKAMMYKNVVFVMNINDASELLDIFSIIEGKEDKSLSFKIDSLLINKNELKKIQKENYNTSLKYTLDTSLQKVLTIVNKSFDF
ncbi:MAG: hypothetical protein ACI81I_000868, partial [Arcobacteraceae bacterium]